jgi:hypothetical protein
MSVSSHDEGKEEPCLREGVTRLFVDGERRITPSVPIRPALSAQFRRSNPVHHIQSIDVRL